MDITELQVRSILNKAVISIYTGSRGSLLDGVARIGGGPTVGHLCQRVIVVAVTTVQTTGKGIEEFVAITATQTQEEVEVLIGELGVKAIGELGLDVAQHDTILLVDGPVAIDILKLGVTRLNHRDGLCGQLAQILIRLNDALETIAIEGAERFAYLHDQRIDIRQGGSIEGGDEIL